MTRCLIRFKYLLYYLNFKIEYVCDVIKSNKNLTNGYYAVGFSQGSQFLLEIYNLKKFKVISCNNRVYYV